MPDRILPDDVPEIGHIYISLGLDSEGGIAIAYDYDGMTEQSAIGHLIAYSDVLRRENEISWLTDIPDFDPGEGPDE